MKKLRLLLTLLFAGLMTFSLLSCDDLLGLGGKKSNEEIEEDDDSVKDLSKTGTLNKTFKLTQISGHYFYYSEVLSGETGWDYEYNGASHTDCIYQISFTSKDSADTKGTFSIYTRERGSTKLIEKLASGEWTSTAAINAAGTLTLTYSGDTTAASDIAVSAGTSTDSNGKSIGNTFSLNVYAVSAAINASDAK